MTTTRPRWQFPPALPAAERVRWMRLSLAVAEAVGRARDRRSRAVTKYRSDQIRLSATADVLAGLRWCFPARPRSGGVALRIWGVWVAAELGDDPGRVAVHCKASGSRPLRVPPAGEMTDAQAEVFWTLRDSTPNEKTAVELALAAVPARP